MLSSAVRPGARHRTMCDNSHICASISGYALQREPFRLQTTDSIIVSAMAQCKFTSRLTNTLLQRLSFFMRRSVRVSAWMMLTLRAVAGSRVTYNARFRISTSKAKRGQGDHRSELDHVDSVERVFPQHAGVMYRLDRIKRSMEGFLYGHRTVRNPRIRQIVGVA